MGENVRVVVRCRPMNTREHKINCRNIVHVKDCMVSVLNPTDLEAPAKEFTYDSVYNEVSNTETIYNDVCYSLVENVLEGYNGTIFAYGQTGCGKTHTMQGSAKLDDIEIGIIPRCFEHIFEAISVAHGVRYLALVSYLEIHNENIRDLLCPNDAGGINHVLKEVPGVGITVPTLSSHAVVNANECHKLLRLGNQNRMVGATLMNETSSRSHSIFTISLEQIHKKTTEEEQQFEQLLSGIRRGKLNLVDLAGSERQNKTGAAGDRLKEATKINLSLSALGNVISALVDGKTKHVPYRDSKLTRLLQDSLGGNTKTLMISCISPADNNYDETLSTLRYASRAKNISNKPKINEDPKDAKLREYQEEILKLKQLLHETQRQDTVAEPTQLRQEMLAEVHLLKEDQNSFNLESQQSCETQPKDLCEKIPVMLNENEEDFQLQARHRIELIKKALIGGERANDVKLQLMLKKRKVDAEKRLSALAHALSRVNQSEDRNLLQVHYTSIQQELNAKNDYLKVCRQKIRALEREVSDLQSEFQLDRADYLESIRRLERNLKFYQQLMNKAIPILRKDGKYWEPQDIFQNSTWNDDFKTWKLPESSMYSFKLPPPDPIQIGFNFGVKKLDCAIVDQTTHSNEDGGFERDEESDDSKKMTDLNKIDILNNYFRSSRIKPSDHTNLRKSDYTQCRKTSSDGIVLSNSNMNSRIIKSLKLAAVQGQYMKKDANPQPLKQNHNLNRSWGGGTFEKLFVKSLNPSYFGSEQNSKL